MKHSGFTLIELMMVVVIIGILALIAYPSYQDQLQKARRTEAKVALMDAASKMEKYFTSNNSYTGATLAAIGAPATTEEGFYALSLSAVTATSYTVVATPVAGAAQAGDTCGTLTLTNTNVKGPNPALCW